MSAEMVYFGFGLAIGFALGYAFQVFRDLLERR